MATTLKSKQQIVDYLERRVHDAASRKMMNAYYEAFYQLANWGSFNDEKFTPTRYAERLMWKGKRYLKDEYLADEGKELISIAIDIL